jgi:hypothetical protein
VAGQVLDISKHETPVRAAASSEHAGQGARIYRFPSQAQMAFPRAKVPMRPRTWIRTYLLIDIAIGLLVWLGWFVWHLMH